ncbi:MAG TPA: hypothetical protein VEQ10_00375, partial [Vicinamibacteria bacterium]|nr:hypothetical protein [Vicinamibacteria bacterium]
MRRLGVVVTLLLLAAPAARAGVATVWAVGDGEKIGPDTTTTPLAARNAAWDGRTVHLFGAGNEVLAFQVIVQADERGIGALSVALPELRLWGGASRIVYAAPAADPSLSAGRPIQLFSVRSMKVTAETHASWAWKPGSPAAPKHTVGWQPVQLVPENARAGRGGFPLAVPAGTVQAVWIEVYTGRGRPAGVYEGNLSVRADGETRALPVALELLDLELPDESSMDAMIFYEPDQ